MLRLQRTSLALLIAFAALPAFSQSAMAQRSPEVTLTRIDCGTPVLNDVGARFSDTYADNDLKVLFTYSCYLIKHGGDYTLWETGHAMTAGAPAPRTVSRNRPPTLRPR